jgi:hypothetical protein
VATPTLLNRTSTSITVHQIATSDNGQSIEYARNTTNTVPIGGWQSATTFTGLTPSTTYYIFARSAENDTHIAGAPSAALTIATSDPGTIEKSAGAAVETPTFASVTNTTITINAPLAPGNGQIIEYAINTTNSAPIDGWQSATTFSGLTGITIYYIFARSAENNTHTAGPASLGLQITTDRPQSANVETPSVAEITNSTITLNAVTPPANGQKVEYAIMLGYASAPTANVMWQESVTFTELARDTHYSIFARSKADEIHSAGMHSAALWVTTTNVIVITTIQQLMQIGSNAQFPLNGHYELGGDIAGPGPGFDLPILIGGPGTDGFRGIFDGKGYTIINPAIININYL